MLVETGKCPSRRSRRDIRIYERPPIAVTIRDLEPLGPTTVAGQKGENAAPSVHLESWDIPL